MNDYKLLTIQFLLTMVSVTGLMFMQLMSTILSKPFFIAYLIFVVALFIISIMIGEQRKKNNANNDEDQS